MTPPENMSVEALVASVRAGIPPASMREEPHRALDALDTLASRIREMETLIELLGCSVVDLAIAALPAEKGSS